MSSVQSESGAYCVNWLLQDTLFAWLYECMYVCVSFLAFFCGIYGWNFVGRLPLRIHACFLLIVEGSENGWRR